MSGSDTSAVNVVDEALRDRLAREFGRLPVWGVVSTFAADSFYSGMTYEDAVDFADAEQSREPGRSAVVVLTVKLIQERPLTAR